MAVCESLVPRLHFTCRSFDSQIPYSQGLAKTGTQIKKNVFLAGNQCNFGVPHRDGEDTVPPLCHTGMERGSHKRAATAAGLGGAGGRFPVGG